MNPYLQREYFFDRGVEFECKKCGSCCTGSPGTVYISEEERENICNYLKNSDEAGSRESFIPFKEGFLIRERPDGRCIYYDSGCRIYQVRPRQCRGFPFWFSNLRSERDWNMLSQRCPGTAQGRLYTRDEIMELIHESMEYLLAAPRLIGSLD